MKDFLPTMKRFTGSCLLIGMLLPLAAGATDATWINNGSIVVAPNIDATNFVNNGTINIATTQPFDTSNTRNFTNSGSMSGSVGFRLDTAPRNSSGQLIGERKLAANFHNRTSGSISASDSSIILGGGGLFVTPGTGSYLLVQASNLINQGVMSVGASGLLQLVGTNVNVSRGGLGVAAIESSTFTLTSSTNFYPPEGIYDNYWGQTNDEFNVSGIAEGSPFGLLASSPPHEVNFGGFPLTTIVNAFINPAPVGFTNVVAALTNALNPTNIFIQAVFIQMGSTNMGADITFRPGNSSSNRFSTVGVRLSMLQTNVITASAVTNSIYFYDTLATSTNRGTLRNLRDGTRRPANYVLSRGEVFNLAGTVTNNIVFTPELLSNPLYDSTTSSGPYAGYSATIDSVTTRLPAIPSADYTNNPGRVEIRAKTLDLSRARIRAEGLLSVQAEHLITSSNAVIDSQNISYELGSTNGQLRIQNLMKESVSRLSGDLNAWSAVWTNSITPQDLRMSSASTSMR